MKPWKWSGFQVDASSVLDWLTAHAREECSTLLCVDDLRTANGVSLAPEDGWREDLRSRGLWDSLSTTTNPPRFHCAQCKRWLGTLEGDHEPRRLANAGDPIVIGTFLWLCDERCLRAFAGAPARAWRPTPKRFAGEILHVRCTHCDKSVEANTVSPLVLADWFTEHLAQECSLEARRAR